MKNPILALLSILSVTVLSGCDSLDSAVGFSNRFLSQPEMYANGSCPNEYLESSELAPRAGMLCDLTGSFSGKIDLGNRDAVCAVPFAGPESLPTLSDIVFAEGIEGNRIDEVLIRKISEKYGVSAEGAHGIASRTEYLGKYDAATRRCYFAYPGEGYVRKVDFGLQRARANHWNAAIGTELADSARFAMENGLAAK